MMIKLPYYLKIVFVIFLTLASLPQAKADNLSETLSKLNKPSQSFLPEKQAFQFTAQKASDHEIELSWKIAPEYYLYQSKLQVELISNAKPSLNQVLAYEAQPSRTIEDPYFGEQAIFEGNLSIKISISNSLQQTNTPFMLIVHYQGCAAKGLCYPPIKKTFTLKADQGRIVELLEGELENHAFEAPPKVQPAQYFQESAQKPFYEKYFSGSFFNTLLSFYLFGLLLGFTPCVLPMLPILSSVIVGEKKLNTQKAFFLSSCYTFSLAFILAIFGSLAVVFGKNFQALFQQSWIIIIFASLFVYLGLAQLGITRIGLPASLNNKLHELQSRHAAGSYINAMVMGAFSSLVASPCVTAPLVGALSFIAQTGNHVLGASALFMMGLGMGTLLIIAGTLGGHYIPKAGQWMHLVNKVFASILFALSIWLLSRILPPFVTVSLWIIWCLGIAWMMGTFKSVKQLPIFFGAAFLIYGGLLSISLMQGITDPLQPLKLITASPLKSLSPLEFKPIKTMAEFDQQLKTIAQDQKPAIIKITADWCTACQQNEKKIFNNPNVHPHLTNWQLYTIDITHMNADKQQLLNALDIYGPPVVMFFDPSGQESHQHRLIGESRAADFIDIVESLKRPAVESR